MEDGPLGPGVTEEVCLSHPAAAVDKGEVNLLIRSEPAEGVQLVFSVDQNRVCIHLPSSAIGYKRVSRHKAIWHKGAPQPRVPRAFRRVTQESPVERISSEGEAVGGGVKHAGVRDMESAESPQVLRHCGYCDLMSRVPGHLVDDAVETGRG